MNEGVGGPHEKLHNALSRGYFRTLDLFAGCGGLSLGFHRAGFTSIGCVELNENARTSHEKNFRGIAPDEGYRSFGDITDQDPLAAVEHLEGVLPPSNGVDVIIGGPPCQAFSRLGRAALWRLAGKDQAHGADERATMYQHYLNFVVALQPIAFVMENVREIGKYVGRNVAEEIAVTADNLGYEVRYALLNATWYGVPQLRERMFLIGIRKELQIVPDFPAREFECEIPVGYSTSRAGQGSDQVLSPRDHFVDFNTSIAKVRPANTAELAFAGLPRIDWHLDGRKGKGNRRDIHEEFRYTNETGEFAEEMKNWPGFVSDSSFNGHVIRYTPRDYETFKRMPEGGMYPEALATARKIFQERLKALSEQLGREITNEDNEWHELLKSTVPPYKENRYPNKFRKMWRKKPVRTVPAHIGKDSYSHIHFDSSQARCVSLREAARLQSFPDAFELAGSMNAQLTQIGNAVPPLLAFAVAGKLNSQLSAALAIETTCAAE